MAQPMGHVVVAITGCHVFNQGVHRDVRGSFSKIMSTQLQESAGIRFVPRELFWSRSQCGVIRGMHTQLPPYSGAKLVWISHGQIRDVVLDLRVDSTTFGACLDLLLDDSSGGLYIPQGCAHGFEVLSEVAVVNYAQDVDYSPTHDSGVAWNSFSFEWQTPSPTISERDRQLPVFSEFSSPFTMSTSL
jgi:dTDP-4-dehydrorhamnose 3,5-epimerase